MTTPYSVRNALARSGAASRQYILDPGANGTVKVYPFDLAVLELKTAGARTLQPAAQVPVGTSVLACATSIDVLVNGISIGVGSFANFTVVLNADRTHRWSLLSEPALGDISIPLTTSTGLSSMTFTTQARTRLFQLESKFRFFETNFAASSMTGLSRFFLSAGTETFTNSSYRYTGAGIVAYTSPQPLQNPWSTLAIDISSFGGGATNDSVAVGIRKATGANTLHIQYNDVDKSIVLNTQQDAVSSGAVVTRLSATVDGTPKTVYAVFNGRYLSMWTSGSLGNNNPKLWGVLDITTFFDIRTDANLAAFFPYFVFTEDAAKTITASAFRHSIFGSTGVQNPTLVRYSDGTPLLRDNKYYLTGSNAGISVGGNFDYTAMHAAIYSMDRNTGVLVEEGKIFTHRSSAVYSDLVPCLTYDQATSTWTNLHDNIGSADIPSTGDILQLQYNTTKADILSGVVTFEDGTRLGLAAGPTTLANHDPTVNSIYDPNMVWIGSTLYVTYVKNSQAHTIGSSFFHVCVASGPSLDNLTEIAEYTGFDAEGPKPQKIGGNWVFTSCRANDGRFYQWNLLTGALIGTFTADTTNVSSAGSPLEPHTNIIPDMLPDGTTRYLMVNFFVDQMPGGGKWAQGTIIIQVSNTKNTGYEFSLRKYLR